MATMIQRLGCPPTQRSRPTGPAARQAFGPVTVTDSQHAERQGVRPGNGGHAFSPVGAGPRVARRLKASVGGESAPRAYRKGER
jgi:hypothetical protein